MCGRTVGEEALISPLSRRTGEHKKKNNLAKIFFGDNTNKHFYKLQKYFLLFLSLNKRKQKYLQKQF